MFYPLLIVFLVALDQITKYWVLTSLPLGVHQDFLPPLLELVYVQNTGAAFSMLAGHTWFLALVSLVLSLALGVAVYQKFFTHPFGRISLAVVLAGAIGNLLDRAFRGFVVDMFNFMFVRFAVFNVADICVVVGGICAGIYYAFYYEKYQGTPTDQEDPASPEAIQTTEPPEQAESPLTGEEEG